MLPIVEVKISTEEFQITDWAAQIAELQARIARSQSRISQLNEDNAVADGLLQAAEAAKGKISDQEIIADLLKQLSRLLSGDNNSNDGNGNRHDEPAPQPNDDGGVEVALTVTSPESEEIGEVVEASAVATSKFEKIEGVVDALAVEPQPEELTGQCCLLEDAPQSSLQGQSVELAQVAFSRDGFKYIDSDANTAVTAQSAVQTGEVVDAAKEPNHFELIPVSDAVAHFRNSKTGEIATTYVGFNSKSKAEKWGKFLTVEYPIASGFELRDAKRLSSFKYEIKLWGLSIHQIQKLAEFDLQNSPHNGTIFFQAPDKEHSNTAPVPKSLQIDVIEVGDIVRSTTIKNWQYKVVGIKEGMFKCEQINVEAPIKVVMHPASVELVSKAAKVEDYSGAQRITIDVNDVPVGVRLERTDDALITEYRVWIWTVSRVKGVPQLQQKTVGTIVAGTDGISAYRVHGLGQRTQVFERTLFAVKYLIVTSDFTVEEVEAAYNRHQEEVGLASIQPPTPQSQNADVDGIIEAGDWVELLVNGERYQVDSVDSEGIHLVTDDGNMLVQPSEVTLQFKLPANWQPF